LSHALRAWTTKVEQPAAATSATKPGEEVELLAVVHADAALHRDRDGDRRPHRRDGVGDPRRLAHQAGAERAALDALGRAAAVQVHLVVAERLAGPGGAGELVRLAAAEL
jgi:hypothetical protein